MGGLCRGVWVGRRWAWRLVGILAGELDDGVTETGVVGDGGGRAGYMSKWRSVRWAYEVMGRRGDGLAKEVEWGAGSAMGVFLTRGG
jgi:hypothetical protein